MDLLRFSRIAGRLLLVTIGAGGGCQGSGPDVTVYNPATVTTPSAAAQPEAVTPAASAVSLTDLPPLSPGYILGNATATSMSPSAVMGACTPALMTTTNTAAQNVAAFTTAARTALSATFGNVCLPPGILPFATVTLTQALSGIHVIGTPPIQSFSTPQPSLGYTLTGGTILKGKGPGSGPAFTYVGPGGAAATWASGFLTNVSFENLGFDSWDREFVFGGTTRQGVSYSKFNNLYGTNIGVRAYDFINSVSLWIDNLYGYFAGSGFRIADDLDNAVYGSTTNSFVGNLQFTLKSFAAEGIVLEATAIGTGGSQLNEIYGSYWFVERPAISLQTQTVSMVAGSPVIAVSNNLYLPVGMPVGFTLSGNGFTAGQTYFVVSSTSSSVQVSNTYAGPAVSAKGSGSMTIKSWGGENIAIRGLGAENLPNAGVVSNVHVQLIDSENASGNCIFLQRVAGGDISLGECTDNVIAGVALRDVTSFTITNGGSTKPTRDNDGYGGEDNYWYGSYSGPDVQAYGFLGQGKDAGTSGNYYRTALSPTLAGAPSPGLSVRGSDGNYLYSDFGIGQPYHIDGNINPTLNAGESGIFAYAGSGGTCTLPAITNSTFATSLIGLPYWFTNIGTGPCKLVTQGGQTFSGMQGATSITVPVGGTVAVSAEPRGIGFTWHVLSYVQPSQVKYGTLSLPTTTVAQLPPCTAENRGLLYAVSDARAPAYNAPLVAGGTVSIPVFCNGSGWTAH